MILPGTSRRFFWVSPPTPTPIEILANKRPAKSTKKKTCRARGSRDVLAGMGFARVPSISEISRNHVARYLFAMTVLHLVCGGLLRFKPQFDASEPHNTQERCIAISNGPIRGGVEARQKGGWEWLGEKSP